jgi:bacillithiol biosynthesis deacetylase BshB1
MKILCIGAHPDDVELSMAGTILTLNKIHHTVHILDLSNGEPTPFGSIEIRNEEKEKAAKILNLKRDCLDLDNRFILETIENRKKLASYFRKFQPEIIFTHYEYDSHPDHISSSNLVDSSKFYSKLTKSDIQGEPFFPKRIIYFFPNHIKLKLEPSFIVDISPYINKKKEILESYHSQFIKKGNGKIIEETIAINRYYGIQIGVEFGEPFYIRESLGIIEFGDIFHG